MKKMLFSLISTCLISKSVLAGHFINCPQTITCMSTNPTRCVMQGPMRTYLSALNQGYGVPTGVYKEMEQKSMANYPNRYYTQCIYFKIKGQNLYQVTFLKIYSPLKPAEIPGNGWVTHDHDEKTCDPALNICGFIAP